MIAAHPPFDEDAQQRARLVVVACGKPSTRNEGLMAIHAAINSDSFRKQKDAQAAFQVPAQRFRKWKKLIADHDAAMQQLAVTAPVTAAAATAPARSHGADVPESGLLVGLSWVSDNCNNINSFRAGAMTVVGDGPRAAQVATRMVYAQVELSDETEELELEVEYDLPPAESSKAQKERWAEKHRLRENAVLRQLDGMAQAEHRVLKAQQRREQRVREDSVAEVLNALIDRVCKNAEREARRWQCPGGCAPEARSRPCTSPCIPSHVPPRAPTRAHAPTHLPRTCRPPTGLCTNGVSVELRADSTHKLTMGQVAHILWRERVQVRRHETA